jgi:cytochrome c oxidase cbb3-type subunit 3/ubiquinol-cytochrome c reductase cytochrome c subunit
MNGPATPIGAPEYQALVDDATLRGIIANGLPGSMMPPFSRKQGGPLTDSQIDSLVKGIRARWYKGNVLAGLNPPPYADGTPGDASRGQQVYGSVCANCHGEIGKEVGDAGSVVNGSLLALIAPQTIRTTVIIGRPDLGMPDWRDLDPGKPLSPAQVTDVIAFLQSKRPAIAGQPYRTAEAPPASSGQDVRTGVHGEQQHAQPLAQPGQTASRRGQQ